MKTIKCPCDNCVCVPMCKFKLYEKMYWDCYLVRDYIHKYLLASNDDGTDPSPFDNIHDILKAIRWKTIGGNVEKELILL